MRILSIPPKKESYHAAIIAFRFDVVIIFLAHGCRQGLRLPKAKLKREQPAGPQVITRRIDQLAYDFVASFPAKKRNLGIMQDFARKRGPVSHRDIRKISHDQIESAIDRIEQVALYELDLLFQAKSGRVFPHQ